VVEARSALVVAPHFDDEVLGCGGLVAQLTAAGACVRVVFCSDGGGETADAEIRRAESARRRQEAREVAAVLGLAGLDELDLPDGALAQHVDALADGLRRLILQHRPGLVLAPSPLEISADHRAVFAGLQGALAALPRAEGFASDAALRTLRVLAYEVNHPLHPDVLVDVSGQVPLIERAMACYASQQERHDYLRVKLGLLHFRTLTLPPSVGAAEAYRQLTLDDFVTPGPAHVVSEPGGAPAPRPLDDGPTISLIVRTKDRPDLLAQALASVAHSTYRRLEVLVINDGGRPPALPATYPVPLTLTNLAVNRGRAGAANAGIVQARGDYVAFLDDDDLVEPEHFALLAGLVRGAGVRVAYTDAAVGIYEPDAEAVWRCVGRRVTYSRDFDPDHLLVDNYIPFNTLLIERGLLAAVGELDPDLPIFEDWDLLIRLSAHTVFHHLARVTCEYRLFRGAAHHALGERPHDRGEFLAHKARVIGKHRARITADAMARVVDHLRAETIGEQATVRALHQQVAQLHARDARLQAQLDGFTRELEAMRATRAWRLAEWWRRVRRRVTGASSPG
jgi:LmbE family N-acetylglucosaminyl deacetylase